MPVMLTYRHPGLTRADYDAVRAEIGWDRSPPSGAIFHAITFDEEGATEVNVFETEDSWNSYLITRVTPVVDARGIKLLPPRVEQLHSVAVGVASNAFLVKGETQPA